jgi:hypothetical protein
MLPPAGLTGVSALAAADGHALALQAAKPTVSQKLTNLAQAVHGVAPGTALFDKVTSALTAYNADDYPTTCSTLGSFNGLVMAQTGKKLTPGQAASFLTQSASIQSDLACTA